MKTKPYRSDSDIVELFLRSTDADVSHEVVPKKVTNGTSYMTKDMVMALIPSDSKFVVDENLFKYNENPEHIVHEERTDKVVVIFEYCSRKTIINQKYISVVEELTGHTIDELSDKCWLTTNTQSHGYSLLLVDIPESEWSIVIAPMIY